MILVLFGIKTYADNSCIIKVSNQEDFNRFPSLIKSMIRKGEKSIVVRLSPGEFHYKHNFLNLSNIDRRDLSITIEGEQSVLIPELKIYDATTTTTSLPNVLLTKDLQYVNIFGEYKTLKSLVEVVDIEKKLCRIQCEGDVKLAPNLMIRINEWFRYGTYRIVDFSDGYLYFVADNLKYDSSKKCYNVNYDFGVSKVLPRYTLICLPETADSVYECTNSMFVVLNKDNIKSFAIRGVKFVGSNNERQLIQVRNTKATNIIVDNCSFSNIHSTILKVEYSDNVSFVNNTIKDCFGRGVWAWYTSKNIKVEGNTFSRSILRSDNVPCISCKCEDYYIAGNTFEDFGSSAISVGIKYTNNVSYRSYGIIEYNQIRYSQRYADFMKKYSSTDGGAIYTSTRNDSAVIRYNFVDNYCGIKSKRSLYCDDGASNVKIYGNVFHQGDETPAVFGWRCKKADSTCLANSGIIFKHNVIWGKYYFDERPNGGCIHDTNVIIYDTRRPNNTLNNFSSLGNDVYISGASIEEGKLKVSKRNRVVIEQLPTYKGMARWIK